MILPSHTEEQILRELVDDQPGIERKARKLAEKEIEKLQKQGRAHCTKVIETYVRSKNGNKWFLIIFCAPQGRMKWSHRSHCVVELGNGKRDIYFLRGLRHQPPYYVRINNHVLRRMRERFHPKEGSPMNVNPDAEIAKIAFHVGEMPVFKRFTRPELSPFLEGCDDIAEVSGLIVMRAAMFVAYLSDMGNYDCRTFFSIDERFVKGSKMPLFMVLQLIYAHFNPREMADMGIKDDMPLENKMVGLGRAFPETRPYIEHAAVGLKALYL